MAIWLPLGTRFKAAVIQQTCFLFVLKSVYFGGSGELERVGFSLSPVPEPFSLVR